MPRVTTRVIFRLIRDAAESYTITLKRSQLTPPVTDEGAFGFGLELCEAAMGSIRDGGQDDGKGAWGSLMGSRFAGSPAADRSVIFGLPIGSIPARRCARLPALHCGGKGKSRTIGLSMNTRMHIAVSGAVQGVGFRPFVYGLAARLGLAGFVFNEPRGVTIELEGPREAIDAFLAGLESSPPPLARIERIETAEIAAAGETGFRIRDSGAYGERSVLVPPDLATCNDCLREMADPSDRRHRYPFINCTNCGPRYTIIQDLPYDRARTTMAEFDMCPDCRAEYEDPANRRFHAEPTCCPVCGPRVWLSDRHGAQVPCEEPITEAIARLSEGAIVAIKGLGGFHLACDAANPEAVALLRARKHRDLKPFALMVGTAVAGPSAGSRAQPNAGFSSPPNAPSCC